MNTADMPHITRHAAQRFAERCGGLDIGAEWYGSRRAGKKTKQKIRDRCPGHAHLMVGRQYLGYWYGVSKARVVFVVDGARNAIVTVFRLPGEGE
ncbi:hypothetical protein L2Y96_18100 [Luteibacter aegosomaticola]|uniref:hypothetical protein n=1 Tax=Luteibacter aegosomaticola TaxID=2911538 RepID=UPI001FF7E11A|nr:hypothetical protein [Luteibacter aegosomaticola]UPG89291.1 hypothetical protein L2Y96_18100 [Luteibacter aegosomaticola]